MFATFLLIIGFVITIYGADLLVSGASSLAKKMNISNLVIGLTVVAFGTSAPELTVNLASSFSGNTDIAIGNVVGSNIANILLILGIAACINPLKVGRGTVWKEIPFCFLSAILIGILASDTLIDGAAASIITRIDGLVLLSFFIIFLYYTFGVAKNKGEDGGGDEVKIMKFEKSILFIVIGLAGLVLGGKWVVDGATAIALMFGMSTTLVGLTIVAIGTSLPELATSAIAAYRGKVDIAIGNVVGSNIFNSLFILGTGAVINDLPFRQSLGIDIAVNISAAMLLFVALFIGKKHIIERWQGILFIFFYIAYIVFLIQRG